MPPVVKHLNKDQCAFNLGEKNIPKKPPKITLERTDKNIYRITVSFELAAAFENLSATPLPLPEGTFAVFSPVKDEDIRPSDFKVFLNATSNVAGTDYTLSTVISSESLPGNKGNHGS